MGRGVEDGGVGRRWIRGAAPRARHVCIAIQIIEKIETQALRLLSGWIAFISETDPSPGRRDTLPEMEELQAFGDRALEYFGSDLGTAFRPYPQTVPGHNRRQRKHKDDGRDRVDLRRDSTPQPSPDLQRQGVVASYQKETDRDCAHRER